jgi:hypothetical protein
MSGALAVFKFDFAILFLRKISVALRNALFCLSTIQCGEDRFLLAGEYVDLPNLICIGFHFFLLRPLGLSPNDARNRVRPEWAIFSQGKEFLLPD